MNKMVYLVCLFFCFSCSSENVEKNQLANQNNTIQQNAHVNEEIYFENDYFKIIKVAYDEFQSELKKNGVIVPRKEGETQPVGYKEEDVLKKCKECHRIDKITLKIGDKVFKNDEGYIDDDTSMVGDSYKAYYLYDYIDGIAFIKTYYYESSSNMLYISKTKQEINMWGYPIYLPSKKSMFVSNMDLVAQFEYNGLQFFIEKNGKWTKAWEQETDFGLQEIHRINDSIIYAERVVVNFSDSDGIFDETQPVKIIIK